MKNEINSYKYENIINFNIDDVKKSIKNILKSNKTRFIHDEKDLNDIFSTYSFGEIKCSYLVALTKVDDNSTKITITCSPRNDGLETSMASLEKYTGELLNIISSKLSGATDEEMVQIINDNNSDGVLSNINGTIELISFVLGAGILLYILFL
jgi:hypothetical protein